MNKKFCSSIGLVFIVLVSVTAFGQDKDPNAAEVLILYKQSLSYLQSVSVKVDIEIDETLSNSDREISPRKTNFVFRQDHDRTEWIGAYLALDEKGAVDASKSFVLNEVMTGEYYGSVVGNINKLPIVANICRDYQETQKGMFDDPEHGSALFGKMYGSNHKGIAELLAESTNLYLRAEQEDINGVSCYVLDGATKYGKVTAWIAPEKGYSALKWSIHKISGDFFNEKPTSSSSWIAIFDSVEVQKIGDVFVTTGGRLTHTNNYTDGRTNIFCYKYKTSNIELNPDFEALGAFKINLPDGTRVFVTEHPGIRYIWQNGKIVSADDPTFEEIDKIVDELKSENK